MKNNREEERRRELNLSENKHGGIASSDKAKQL